jgi:hypothetical protein
VLANTPIGDDVFVLKLGVNPVLSGSHAANKVAEVEDGKVVPAGMLVPYPSAVVFQPINLYPVFTRFPVFSATGLDVVDELHWIVTKPFPPVLSAAVFVLGIPPRPALDA